MSKINVNCDSCCYNYYDELGEINDCESCDITEELKEKHYTKGEPNCPCWKEDYRL